MSIPTRNADPSQPLQANRTFFVTTATWGHARLLQSHRMARLLVDALYHYRSEHKYTLHDFVVMPDHLHALVTVGADIAIERAVQLIKGGFSYRASHEQQFQGEVWQRGFSEVRIFTPEAFLARQTYIRENPVRAGLVASPEQWEYSSAHPGYELDENPFAGAKAPSWVAAGGTTKVVP
ncbi:MAG: transposase [Acidobacteriia bacterium]|nr:transposase [Terriglobia bacterium]